MKKSIYKPGFLPLILLLFLSVTLSAQEVTKEFHKEYTVNANTTLDLNNKYGDVIVTTSDNNQVVIDVKVTVELPNKEQAEKLLSYIDVLFSEETNLISAKTVIDQKFSFKGWGNSSRRFSIDYNVKMPAKTALTLANRYGNTDLDELGGLVNLDIRYGDLTAGQLARGNIKPLNKLYLAYGKGTIDEAGWLDLTLRYSSNLEIKKCQALLLDSKYSKLFIDESSSIVGESRYDKISIENVNNLVLENGYTETTIGQLTQKLSYIGSYGSFSIDKVPSGFESMEVDTRYMGVRLGIEESANYKLDAKVTYGGLRYNEDNFKFQNRIIQNNSNIVSGTIGKEESPSSKVTISSSYGTVRLY